MSYKTKLQTNNENLEGNNIDLQTILNTINELPAAGGSTENLDAEITEQEGLIEQIEAALVGKAAGGNITPPEYNMVKTTINYNINSNNSAQISYLGINEDGLLKQQVESLSGNGSITIQSNKYSLIDCYVDSWLEPVVTVNWETDGNFDGYQDAYEHYNIITADSRWVVLYPGGIFTVNIQ